MHTVREYFTECVASFGLPWTPLDSPLWTPLWTPPGPPCVPWRPRGCSASDAGAAVGGGRGAGAPSPP